MIYLPDFSEVLAVSHSRGQESLDPGAWDNLRGCWTKLQGGGSKLYDVSGYGNDGTVNGPEWTASDRGLVLNYDGSTPDSVNITTPVVTDYPFSVALWYKATDHSTSRALWSLSDQSVGSTQYYILHSGGGTIQVGLRNTGFVAAASPSISDGEWVHIVGTWSSSTLRAVYINGVFKADNTTSVSAFTPTRMDIGRLGDSSPNFWANGLIGDVQVYGHVLAPTEIQKLYTSRLDMFTLRRRTPVGTAAPPAGGTVNPLAMGAINLLAGKLAA